MNPGTLLLAAALAVLPVAAYAHATKGVHGGSVGDAGSFHVELVSEGTVLQVYLRDHAEKAIDSRGYKGTAIIVIDGKAERIILTPSGGNSLKGTASVNIPKTPKGAVQITTPTGSTVQAKFN
jgi:hypothetical protein